MLRFMKVCCCAAAALAIVVVPSPVAANLLVNPGFEDPITSDGPPFVGFWEAFNGGNTAVAQNSTLMPRHWQPVARTVDRRWGSNTYAGAFQDVEGLTSGQVGTFSGWHKLLGDPGGIEIRIEWRNSGTDTEVSRTPNFVPTPGSEYELFELAADVPAGAIQHEWSMPSRVMAAPRIRPCMLTTPRFWYPSHHRVPSWCWPG